MKYYNLVVGEEKISFKVPTSWNEVSFQKYIQYVELLEKSVEMVSENDLYKEIYSLFTGLTIDTWEMNLDAQVYYNIDNDLSFIGTNPSCERPTDIKRGDKFYPIVEDFLNLPIGKYRDIMNVVSEGGLSKLEQVKSIPKMIAVIACDDYETESELEQIAEDIELIPADEVTEIAAFFLSKLNQLKSGTQEKPSVEDSSIAKNKLDTEKLLKIMDSSIRFTISPIKILLSMMRFLIKKFRKFIGLSNYKVASVMQTKDMLI